MKKNKKSPKTQLTFSKNKNFNYIKNLDTTTNPYSDREFDS